MANAVKGEVEFQAGGQARVLRLDTNALCEVETFLGKPAPALFEEMKAGGAGLREVRAIIAGGSSMSLAEAGRAIDELGMERCGELITQAFILAFPEAKGGEPGNPPKPAKGGTG